MNQEWSRLLLLLLLRLLRFDAVDSSRQSACRGCSSLIRTHELDIHRDMLIGKYVPWVQEAGVQEALGLQFGGGAGSTTLFCSDAFPCPHLIVPFCLTE
jgi:hypothetical protein